MTPQKTTPTFGPKKLQTRTARRAGAKSCSKNSSANSAMPQTVIVLNVRLEKSHHKECETVAVRVTGDALPEEARQHCSMDAACDSPTPWRSKWSATSTIRTLHTTDGW